MTDPSMPSAEAPPPPPPLAPLVPPPPALTGEPAPASGPASTGAPAKPGKLRAYIVIGVIVALLAVILYAVKDNASAEDLKIGDCFDVPSSASVSTVVHHPCTEAHTAEVIHVTEYTEPGTYPISLTLERFIDTACVPVFKTYVGVDFDAEPDLTIGYFYPSRDGWSSGDRTITCYITRIDDAPMTKSVKGSGAAG